MRNVDPTTRELRATVKAYLESTMAERGWSMGAWAKRANTSPTNVSRFLRDPVKNPVPSTVTLHKLGVAAERGILIGSK